MNDKLKRLLVSTPQGPSGTLDKASRFVFNYTTTERPCEVSLGMPIGVESYGSSVLHPLFAMNRPEGYLLDRIRNKFGKLMQLDDMRLLALTGANQIGRLRYAEPDAQTKRLGAGIGLTTILENEGSAELFEYLVDTYLTSGISGFQPKVMIPDADKLDVPPAPATLGARATIVAPDLIVKASGEDYPHLAQNEFLCMDAARRAGLTVPDFWLSESGKLFVMGRFDLDGERQLGFEDMVVLMNRTNEEKYLGSYEQIAKVINAYCGTNAPESCRRFFEYLALTVLVRNGDAHLKNFGLLYEDPHTAPPKLSPLFDVVTTMVYKYQNKHGVELTDRELAIKLAKSKRYPDRKTLIEFGRNACGVAKPEEVLQRLSDAMADTLAEHGPKMHLELMREMRREWDGGRLAMATDDVYQRAVVKGMSEPLPDPL
ncbi:type II toxin-antitoxin system HipA family toxin [Cupriavidus sp. UYPR2.512]|uniref:type II toxin-antitoxin system HipA family toxin n=1 Tax=Cupriavidus sp. UYPR2.512 TaxID=1080187 RepID=UPI0003678AAD|nr:type II toxin-antitoxin system HipA family toxin [Cupriavidus sp. UYPR2.512]UIF88976.1 type II toxin-antitoxin system HipA family toxin [Cupriavidus necator]